MKVVNFEIIDLGADISENYNTWGVGRRSFNSCLLGMGETAQKAMEDILNQLAGEGLDCKFVEVKGREQGYYGNESQVGVEDLLGDDEAINIAEAKYLVGLRFDDPSVKDDDIFAEKGSDENLPVLA